MKYTYSVDVNLLQLCPRTVKTQRKIELAEYTPLLPINNLHHFYSEKKRDPPVIVINNCVYDLLHDYLFFFFFIYQLIYRLDSIGLDLDTHMQYHTGSLGFELQSTDRLLTV